MDKLHPAHYATISLAVVTVLLLVLLFLLKKKTTLLSQQLVQLTTMLEITRKRLARLQEKHDKIVAFQNSLKTAELTTMLQKPRLNAQSTASGPTLSGKYSRIKSLAEKGLSVDEIAAILGVSTHEARQLVNLSKLAQ
ncbi:hypothetical protein FCL47_11955 [Desulfopila sp. IMCC35006]|uniref:hypothetical protein n=1 Tax=Desulfopila sp. IMCC35006 TaxID=2569542 RepID=UPI0010AD3069|nr:hypothetical protein [Desulfopila sp. IMCC35006]TKB25814.1 hypothetical protein FCL47_11955 [Desulfopila sp. IMCC35006]